MGPRPLGRGWWDGALGLIGQRMASMGPRPLGRGWKPKSDRVRPNRALQWGRDR